MQKVVFVCIFAVLCQTDFHLPSCCQMPDILPGLDDAWEKCFEKFKQFKDKPESKEFKEMSHKNNTPCLFQCIFMHSGLSTSDGNLNEEEITKKMSEGMNNNEKFKSLWQQTLNKCFDEVKDEDKKIVPMMNTPAGRLMKCFLRDLYMNCPKGVWVESSECSSIKNLVQKCPEMPPPVFKGLPKLI